MAKNYLFITIPFKDKFKSSLVKYIVILTILGICINKLYYFWNINFQNEELTFPMELTLYNFLILTFIIFNKIPLKIKYLTSILSFMFLYLVLNINYIYFEKNFTMLNSVGFCILIMYSYILWNLPLSNSMDALMEIRSLNLVLNWGDKYIKAGNKITIYVLDINHFKDINDTYGYLIGNKILIQIAQALKEYLKNYNSIIGRLGGEEFVILIKDIDETQAMNLMNNIETKMTNKYFDGDKELAPIKITCTIGMAHTDKKTIKTQELLHMADKNMYYNKYYSVRLSIDEDLYYYLNSEYKDLLRVLYEKDIYTFVHSESVAYYATSLAKYLKLSDLEIQEIAMSSWLHDIGKMIISDEILRKKERLTDEEYAKMKSHIVAGLNILSGHNLSQNILDGIKYHHERWDGNGYPFGISGEKTPLYARIIQIADSFSAMTIKRVYREKMCIIDALIEINKFKGSQFDPLLAGKFIHMVEKNL